MEKTVLVAGASRGLGHFLAKKYLEDGCRVFAGVRDTNSPKTVELKSAYPGKLTVICIDVSSTASANDAFKTVFEQTDRLDVIINNAGIHSKTSFNVLEETDIDDCLNLFSVNSLGPLRIVKAFLPLINNKNFSLVANISSTSGCITTAGDWREKEFGYCMSKAAMNMGTRQLNLYLAKKNTKVVAVHPGWIRTDMGGQNADNDPYEAACKLITIFDSINKPGEDHLFFDLNGKDCPW